MKLKKVICGLTDDFVINEIKLSYFNTKLKKISKLYLSLLFCLKTPGF